MKNPFKFEPDPISILVAIAAAVAVAGATVYVGVLLLWVFGRFPPSSAPAQSPFTPLSIVITLLITLAAAAGLWRYTGQANPQAPKSLRATYTAGISLIVGWWLGLLLFGFAYFSG